MMIKTLLTLSLVFSVVAKEQSLSYLAKTQPSKSKTKVPTLKAKNSLQK